MKILSSSHKSSVRTSAVGSIPSLYVMKALLAISVVALHSPHSLPWIGLPGLMVELFFVVTGYFLYHPDLGKVQDRIWKSVKKVIPLILILQLFYAILIPPAIGNPLTTYWMWVRLLFIGLTSFYSGHLWYLTALLLGLVCFSFYLKCFRGRRIPLLFSLILVWAVLDPFRHLLFGQEQSIFAFSFFARAIPFLAVGYYIYANEQILLRYRWENIYFILLILMGIEMLLWGYLDNWDSFPSLINLLPLRFSLFMLFLSHKNFGQGTWLEVIGEKYSGNIYYFHMAVIFGWTQLNSHSPLLSKIYDYGGALIVTLISLGIAWVVVKVQDKLGYRILK